jgi:EmrB/QacA subfamily drug resistance transporter
MSRGELEPEGLIALSSSVPHDRVMATTNAEAPTATDTADRLDPALLKLAGIVLVGAVAVQLDATIVNVAIDTLGRDLHAGLATIQWVSTGYLLALAMVIPLAGWSVDRFGSKRMWLLSLAAFLGGSVLCGLAWSAGSLIAFRVVQGIGGGLLFPLLQTILAQAAGPRRLGRLTAVIAVPALVAPVVGPVIGGLILDSLSWHWIFYINIPVCVIALLLAWRYMPDPRAGGEHPLDLLGLALLSPGLASIVYGLSEAGSRGAFGNGHVIAALAIGITLVVAFAVHALRTRTEPLIDLRLFRVRSFTASAGLMFVAGLSLFGAMLLLPLYYQQARDLSALDAGLLLAPQGLGMMIALPVVGRLTDRIGPRSIVLVGIALATLGTIPYTQVGQDTSELALGAALVVRGAGLGALFVPATTAAYRDLRHEAIPRATSAVRIFQQVGASFGTAVLAVILQHQAAGQAGAAGLSSAFGHTFWWAVGFTALAFIAALLLPSARPGAGGSSVRQAPAPLTRGQAPRTRPARGRSGSRTGARVSPRPGRGAQRRAAATG